MTQPAHAFRGCWDYPFRAGRIGSPVSRSNMLGLIGWACGPNVQVRISVDGEVVATTRPSFEREDIRVIFWPDPEASEKTGWAYGLDATAWPPGPHRIAVDLFREHEIVLLGERIIEFPSQVPSALWMREIEPLLSGQYEVVGNRVYRGSKPGSWLEHATSAWGFSPEAEKIITEADGWVLAVGAGINNTLERVIQLDIFDYPNIDVVTDGGAFPFRDESMAGVICENLIEHVPDPADLVSEIHRVLKPGGAVSITGTNMHFAHGYPHHYFNPTECGMRHLLEKVTQFRGSYTFCESPDFLEVILGYYLRALSPEARARVNAMTIQQLLSRENSSLLRDLSPEAERAISPYVHFCGRKVR
jgi:SAM-dependent methyltransferase